MPQIGVNLSSVNSYPVNNLILLLAGVDFDLSVLIGFGGLGKQDTKFPEPLEQKAEVQSGGENGIDLVTIMSETGVSQSPEQILRICKRRLIWLHKVLPKGNSHSKSESQTAKFTPHKTPKVSKIKP